jgi:hypothetical protein
MNTFSQAVAAQKSAEISRTENGMKAFATTDSKVLDLFGKIGSSRGRDLTSAFSAALAEDENLAIRILLWVRDVRAGAGERAQFRNLLRALEQTNPALAGKLISKIPFLGRADDLFSYQDPINRRAALRMYADALMDGNKLFGKWAPRLTSSKKATTAGKKEKQKNARDLMKFMLLEPKEYRQLLVRNTEAVEQLMAAKKWNEINFSHVPSLASARYQKAFGKNAGDAYSAYIRELQKPVGERDPKVRVNSGAVYPYDVVKSLRHGNKAVADAQFDALPNYVGNAKILPMVDVSGSMSGHQLVSNATAMDVAISLGLYLSDRTSSDFKDMFMTFSSRPQIEVLRGTLSQKFTQLSRAHWEMGTNLHAAFEELLRTARAGNVSAENMPDTILVLSDMQFNSCAKYDDSAIQMIKRKYHEAGYKMPQIVFWNLAARASADQSPVKMNDNGVALVSGFSPAIMATVLGADPEEFSPWSMMMKVIMNERYDY